MATKTECQVPERPSTVRVPRRRHISDALNNTTSPAGIAANDPEASPLDDGGKTFARREAVNGSPPAEYVPLAVAAIHASPTNPRKDFDAEALAKMAHGFKLSGVLQPVIVRPNGEGYELIAGERRWRAARIAKLTMIPCRVVDVTDEEAVEIQARENLDREDLNPIERARQFQVLLEKCGLTQEALGKRFDVSQADISNTMRLLKLPEAWQKRIISGEITPAHARELLAWSDVDGLQAKVDELVKDGAIGSVKDFRHDVIGAVWEFSRSIDPQGYDRPPCRFRPSKAQAAELDIREVPGRWGGDRKERRAFNIPKWNEFNAAAKKKARDEAKKKPKSKKMDWKEEHQRRERQWARERHGRRVYLEKANTIARLIGERLDSERHADLALRALLGSLTGDARDVGEVLYEFLGIKGGLYCRDADAKIVGALVGMSAKALHSLPFELAKRILSATGDSDSGRDAPGSPALHAWLCKELKIDFEKEWKPSLEFLELFEGDDRTALIEQIQSHPDCPTTFRMESPATTTDEIIVSMWPPGFVPRELLLVDSEGRIPSGKKKTKSKG